MLKFVLYIIHKFLVKISVWIMQKSNIASKRRKKYVMVLNGGDGIYYLIISSVYLMDCFNCTSVLRFMNIRNISFRIV